MKTTADIMSLANDYANADNVIDSAQKQQALRLAVDRLVAERDALLNLNGMRFAGWFAEVPSGMSYRLWEQCGHERKDGDVALYEL